MIDAIETLATTIPNPVATGCVLVGLGTTIVSLLAPPLKSRADRAKKARTEVNRAPARRLRVQFIGVLIIGVMLNAVGTWLTIHGSQAGSEAMLKTAREENEKARKEFA